MRRKTWKYNTMPKTSNMVWKYIGIRHRSGLSRVNFLVNVFPRFLSILRISSFPFSLLVLEVNRKTLFRGQWWISCGIRRRRLATQTLFVGRLMFQNFTFGTNFWWDCSCNRIPMNKLHTLELCDQPIKFGLGSTRARRTSCHRQAAGRRRRGGRFTKLFKVRSCASIGRINGIIILGQLRHTRYAYYER